jgi:hypothetical protein
MREYTPDDLVMFLLISPTPKEEQRSLLDRVNEIKSETGCTDLDIMRCLVEAARKAFRLWETEIIRQSGFVPLESEQGQAIMREVEQPS